MIEQAVLDFLDALDPDLRRAAVFPFASDERRNWHYVPKERRGVPLTAMSEAQHQAAKALLRAALSERGYSRVEDIMWLETVLAELEQDHETYGPLNYVFSVFGDPAGQSPWGWRVDGHHLSLNFAHVAGETSVTPTFYGAHPATVAHGPRAGLRVLGNEEDLGHQLIRGLPEEQRAQAVISPTAFADIITGPGREDSLRQPVGLDLGAMTEAHCNLVLRIIEEFVGTMRPAAAEAERARIRDAGLERIRFAWAGGLELRQPHYYRLHGPTLVIEYDNTQNEVNHIHSVWHDPGRDFGLDLLRRHYESQPHRAGRHANAGRPGGAGASGDR